MKIQKLNNLSNRSRSTFVRNFAHSTHFFMTYHTKSLFSPSHFLFLSIFPPSTEEFITSRLSNFTGFRTHAIPSTGSTFMILMLTYHCAIVELSFSVSTSFYHAVHASKGTSLSTRFEGSEKSHRINFCSTSIGFHSNLSPFFN